jgi:methylenetetrahydrofolate dehydrogenase (NADP+) / methenyltetrahydrofolate cyclohydrolase
MPTAELIDGKAIAAALRTSISAQVADFKASHGVTPGLAVVLVGEDPASQIYVRNKAKQTVECGMNSIEHKLDSSTPEAQLLAIIDKLNSDANVHGILVQLPLPDHIDSKKIIERIDPAKDVDGFHPVNVGRLSTGDRGLVSCTPAGCMILLKSVEQNLSGLEAVVVGRSNIVGKPVAQLLLRENCTVTIAHSRTRDLPAVVRRADIVVAAVGQSEMIRGDWLKPDSIVIDVGMNRLTLPDGKSRLTGDVAFEEAREVARAITPVPGGVGPMTIACLLKNTVEAASAAFSS